MHINETISLSLSIEEAAEVFSEKVYPYKEGIATGTNYVNSVDKNEIPRIVCETIFKTGAAFQKQKSDNELRENAWQWIQKLNESEIVIKELRLLLYEVINERMNFAFPKEEEIEQFETEFFNRTNQLSEKLKSIGMI